MRRGTSRETHVAAWARNRDNILKDMKNKLAHGSPLQYLESKYPTSDAREGYARALWQMLPPQGDEPPFLDGDVPGKYPSHVSAKDARVVHVATLAFSETSMVSLPNNERCMKLADEILTYGFVTDTEPLMLNVSETAIEVEAQCAPGIPHGATPRMGSGLSARSAYATTSQQPALSRCTSS